MDMGKGMAGFWGQKQIQHGRGGEEYFWGGADLRVFL